MKSGIHPSIHQKATITCTTCGAVFQIPSTTEEIKVETCRFCHPVYTGKKQKEMKGGRVERFRNRVAKSSAASGADKKKDASTTLSAGKEKQ